MPDDTTEDKKEEATETAEETKTEEAKEAKEEQAPEASAKEKAKEEKKATKAVSKKLDDLISEIEKLSVLELSELVHALEDKFGVSASAAVAVSAGPAAGAAAAGEGEDEGQTTFNVVLTESGANKISVIKAVRELVPTLGLKEAKDLVDAPPKPILEGVNKETATEAKTKLETAGAKVELK